MVLTRAVRLPPGKPVSFKNADQIGSWVMKGVGSTVSAGGLPANASGDFQPTGQVSRALAAQTFSQAILSEAPKGDPQCPRRRQIHQDREGGRAGRPIPAGICSVSP